jgi:hypothetical protein
MLMIVMVVFDGGEEDGAKSQFQLFINESVLQSNFNNFRVFISTKETSCVYSCLCQNFQHDL